MNAGLSSKFNILAESPLDQFPSEASLPAKVDSSQAEWTASRYNIHSTTEDGRLIVWNTLCGSISIFSARQRDTVKSILTKRGFKGSPEGLSGYLRDRGFLIPAGTNEYSIFQLNFGQQHYKQDALELILLASEDCNFRCEYCYEDFARGTMQAGVRAAIKKLVHRKLDSIRDLSVGWFGGEPLYGWAAIEDLAPFFQSVAEDNGINFHSNITTNGYLLNPERAEELLSWGVRHYQITLDGNPEDHNRNRPTRQGEPTFDIIFRNLLSLKQRRDHYVAEIRVNFDRNNCSRLHDFINLIGQEFGGDHRFRLRLRAVGRWGGSGDNNIEVCEADDARELSYQLIQEADKLGLSSCDGIHATNSFGSKACYAARPYNFIIGADGKVMKCTVDLDKKERNIVGYIDEDGNLNLDKAKFAMWTEPAYATDKGCQKCVVLPLCQGISCPIIRMDEDRSPCIPNRMNAKRDLLVADRAKTATRRNAPTARP